MPESENKCYSDVDNFPLQTKLVRDFLNMKTGKKGEHARIANVQYNAKTKLQFKKTLGKTSRVLVFPPEALRKSKPMISCSNLAVSSMP